MIDLKQKLHLMKKKIDGVIYTGIFLITQCELRHLLLKDEKQKYILYARHFTNPSHFFKNIINCMLLYVCNVTIFFSPLQGIKILT